MSTKITESLANEIKKALDANPDASVVRVGEFTIVKEDSEAIKDHSGKTLFANIIHETAGRFRVYLG